MKKMQKKCRLCRREGVKLFLKGERCSSQKCALQRRNYPPGSGPDKRFSKGTEYGKQLREKQKARRIFGVSERYFSRCYKAADASHKITGDEFIRFLEMRLDNVIFRSGLASTRSQARQMVSHRFFLLNKRRTNIPSIRLKVGDKIELEARYKKSPVFKDIKDKKERELARWIHTDFSKFSLEIKDNPGKEDFDPTINTQAIVEFYSR